MQTDFRNFIEMTHLLPVVKIWTKRISGYYLTWRAVFKAEHWFRISFIAMISLENYKMSFRVVAIILVLSISYRYCAAMKSIQGDTLYQELCPRIFTKVSLGYLNPYFHNKNIPVVRSSAGWILYTCFWVWVQKLFLSARPLPERRSAVAF